MADCKVCGGWFSSTAPSELCPICERALKRLNGYAVPVVRCKDCKYRYTPNSPTGKPFCTEKFGMQAKDDDFCSEGERCEGE